MRRRTSRPEAAATISWMTASGLAAPRAGMPAPKVGIGGLGIHVPPAELGQRVQQADPPAAVALDGDELEALQRRGVAGVVDVGVLSIQHLAHHGAEREVVDGDAAAERAADHVDHRNAVTEIGAVSSRSVTSISMPAMSSRSSIVGRHLEPAGLARPRPRPPAGGLTAPRA